MFSLCSINTFYASLTRAYHSTKKNKSYVSCMPYKYFRMATNFNSNVSGTKKCVTHYSIYCIKWTCYVGLSLWCSITNNNLSSFQQQINWKHTPWYNQMPVNSCATRNHSNIFFCIPKAYTKFNNDDVVSHILRVE